MGITASEAVNDNGDAGGVMLRLLADDLSGALDSAAPFAAARGALPVLWDDREAGSGDAAYDSETRDADAATAARTAGRWADRLAGAALAFKKLDSQLRGQPAAEIAAVARAGGFVTTVVAPAFPAQGRITRAGQQWLRSGQNWQDAGVDLQGGLLACGLSISSRPPGPGGGAFLCDAACDADLTAIAELRPTLSPPVLWCGSGGLARALAKPAEFLRPDEVLAPPIIVVAGTHHPATMAQLARLAGRRGRFTVVTPALAGPVHVDSARRAVAAMVDRVASAPRPGSVVVTGGETLMGLCRALGTEWLSVAGELAPGVPAARFVGGRWDGLFLVAKSGGFGGPSLLRDLLAHSLEIAADG